MFKTISAALLAASVFVAPAMAGTARTGHATGHAPAVKSATHKSNVLNANAKMGRHHHHRHHHHRAHKHY